jgi:DNA-binding SARP family transcriptional activator
MRTLRDRISVCSAPVEVLANGQALQLGGRRQRTLLALLLLGGDAGVSTEWFAEELWNGSPPPGAATTLRSYVSRLRTVLGHDVVVARPSGYALVVASEQIDAHRFERLLRDGQEALVRGAAGLASDRLHGALALWRGTAFADVGESRLLELEAKRLGELRLACLEERIPTSRRVLHPP